MDGIDLVKAAQNGDEEAFYKLIVQYKNKLYNIAYCYLKSEPDALEAIQEVTCRAFIKLKKLKESEYFLTWITRIMINYCIDEGKRKKKIVFAQQEIDEVKEESDLDNIILSDAVKKLEPRYRKVIILKYFQDMSISDIARIMECPEGTIKTWNYRALEQLRNILSIEGEYNV